MDHQRGLYDLTELCARNRISRKTGYERLARYAAEGARGLVERSQAPHAYPHRMADAVAALLIVKNSSGDGHPDHHGEGHTPNAGYQFVVASLLHLARHRKENSSCQQRRKCAALRSSSTPH